MKTIEEYFGKPKCIHEFKKGDELTINNESSVYMLANLDTHTMALVAIRNGGRKGFSCTKIFTTEGRRSATFDELSTAINVSVRKLTNVETCKVYEAEGESMIHMPFGTRLKHVSSKEEYIVSLSELNGVQYGSIIKACDGKPYHDLIKVTSCTHVLEEELSRMMFTNDRCFNVMEE